MGFLPSALQGVDQEYTWSNVGDVDNIEHPQENRNTPFLLTCLESLRDAQDTHEAPNFHLLCVHEGNDTRGAQHVLHEPYECL